MKHLIFFAVILLLSVSTFAVVPELINSQSVTFPQQLSSAFKAVKLTNHLGSKNDIIMVYGGQDISRRPSLTLHTTTI